MAHDVAHLLYAYLDLYILFGEMSLYFFCPFSNWIVCFLLLNFESSLYSHPLVSAGGLFQDPPQMPKSVDAQVPYIK